MEGSKIGWTDNTFNPWMGCTKVSPACKHCYAEFSTPVRTQGIVWGKGMKRERTGEAYWHHPRVWNKKAPGSRVFCASLADWLDDEVPIEWLADLLELIADCPNLNWQMLSKRPENWKTRLQAAFATVNPGHTAFQMIGDWLQGKPPRQIWAGTTVENQEYADRRIPDLLNIPARIRFLSIEPMLGPIDLTNVAPAVDEGLDIGFDCLRGCLHGQIEEDWSEDRVHWVITGGESRPTNPREARPFRIDHANAVMMQCADAKVPVFMKQMGHNAVLKSNGRERPMQFTGKGDNIDQWPVWMQIQDNPDLTTVLPQCELGL